MNVYLCSRVAKDARPLNNLVAESLQKSGFEVYVPHEQAPNNPKEGERFNKELIWEYDYAAMNRAKLCVVVGRVGKDCSFEIGWFRAKNIPIYFVAAGDETYQESPMLIPSLTSKPVIQEPSKAGELIKKDYCFATDTN